MNNVKWNIVYEILAKALFEFYKKFISSNKSPGEELYLLLNGNTNFKEANHWIDKFDKEFGVKSIDPIHVFASINGSTITDNTRIERIRILLILLGVKYNIENIVFEGCPTPIVTQILTARDLVAQKQIWDLFQKVFQKNRQGISQLDFTHYSDWNGIEFTSFTIFLFWINSDNFLPIDRNTRSFLVASRLIPSNPKNYQDYVQILKNFHRYNVKYNNERYGSKGLFREIAHISYQTIAQGINEIEFSKQFLELQQNIEKSSKEKIPKIKSTSKTQERPKETLEKIVATTNIGFKIIAIKPLSNCRKEYLNILNARTTYYFENAFTIKGEKIEYQSEQQISLFDIKKGTNTLKINVTAIVGKNGSGKSSLVELFFRVVNNISFKHKESLKTNDIKLEEGLAVSLYYILSGNMFCVTVRNDKIQIQEYTFNVDNFKKAGKVRNFEFEDFQNWFYTIAVNYSHYALNDKSIGPWIKELFHKNDAYQTPIVINPMRTGGNIDIKVENGLVKYRLLSNLFSLQDDGDDIGIRQVTESQKAYQVYFDIIPDKNKILFKYKTLGGKEVEVPYEKLKINEKIYSALKKEFNLPQISAKQKHITDTEAVKYIIRKLVSISITYPHYDGFFSVRLKKFKEKSFVTYLKLLNGDPSHITYKLKQAINYLKYPKLLSRAKNFKLDINDYSERVSNFQSRTEGNKIIELIPPPIFETRIELIDKNNKKSDFDKLSSGEKQLIYSANSIFYNIQNLESVDREKKELISYNNINLLLDEIELYYHPELQRKYVAYLVRMLGKLSLNKIQAINICLVTHSPYILSDIPNTFILRLDNGKPKVDGQLKTFGANIHDLLKNDFFLKNGSVGEFAKEQIKAIVDKLSDKKLNIEAEKENMQKVITIIGEPLINERLQEMFNDRFKSDLEIQKEIENLTKKLKERKNEKN